MKRGLGGFDLEAIKETIERDGEVRFHIIRSQSNLTVKCRLWHPDGHVLGVANGGGYDRAGAALGEAVEVLFREELKALKAGYRNWRENGGLTGAKVEGGLSGLTRGADGGMSLDGSCGLECMLDVLRALGFERTDKYETGPRSTMVLARRT